MNQIDVAYLAGVIDSDGCIRVERLVQRKLGSLISYCAMVHVQQVESEAVHLAKDIFGGYIQHPKPPARFPKARPMVRWVAKSRIAVRALTCLRPYLRIKAEQADNAIALGKLVWEIQRARYSEVIPTVRGPRTRTQAEIDRLHGHFEISRHLNSGHRSQQTGFAI